MRPTNCNSVARHRFDNTRPTTYAAAYDDGSYGPERATREDAERDYTISKKHTTQPRYEVHVIGDEQRDTFPYGVRDTSTGSIVNAFTHRQIAEDYASRKNGHTWPASIYDVTEADEMI